MVGQRYIPAAGDLVWTSFDPQSDTSKPDGVQRWCNGELQRQSWLALACPVTSHAKGYPFEVGLMSKRVRGVVLADQVRSLDWRTRQFAFIERAAEETVITVRDLERC